MPRAAVKSVDAQDHGADELGHGRLEDVGATAGAVADVVPDEVGDDRRVTRVILRDAGLDLADQVGADVGRFGVDAAAKLGEERHEGAPKAKPTIQKGVSASAGIVLWTSG